VQEGAQGGIGFIEDEDEAAEFFELVGDDRLGDCLVEAVEIEFAEQAEQDDLDVTLGEVAIDQGELGVGDDDVDLTISTSIQVQDFTFPVAFEFALARSGRTAAFVGLFAIGGDAIGEDAGDLLTLLLEEAGAESG
jgi:hypothetical protein